MFLSFQMKASSVKNYLKYMINFCEYYRDHGTTVTEEKTVINNSITSNKTLKRTISRKTTQEDAARRLETARNPPSLAQPINFMRNAEVMADSIVSLEMIEAESYEDGIPASIKTDWSNVTKHLASIFILMHAQRPGMISNLTMKEYENYHEKEGEGVLYVQTHKTNATHAGYVKLTEEQKLYFDRYYNVRKKIKTPCKNFVINSVGNPYRKAGQEVNRYQEKYNFTPMTATLCRKAVETEVANMDRDTQEHVADYLSHSTATAKSSYRVPTTEMASLQRSAIDEMQEYTHTIYIYLA